jgi:hypothetical protein
MRKIAISYSGLASNSGLTSTSRRQRAIRIFPIQRITSIHAPFESVMRFDGSTAMHDFETNSAFLSSTAMGMARRRATITRLTRIALVVFLAWLVVTAILLWQTVHRSAQSVEPQVKTLACVCDFNYSV